MNPPTRPPPARPRGRLSRRALVTKQKMAALAKSGAASESVWAEMSRKMDEVYAEVARSEEELRHAYKALSEAHEQLKNTQLQLVQSEKLASLGRLVAGVAHEINNPISFVFGNAHAMKRYAGRLKTYLVAVHGRVGKLERETLRRELKIDRIFADIEPLIEGIVEGAERTRGIVEALKRFSTADRNEQAVFNLTDVVRRAAQWVARASPTRMRVEFALPANIPVMGSAGQMHQVVVNLVQNAADSTADVTGPKVRIVGASRGGQALLEFHDNGKGIDPAHLGRVFDPFFTTKPVGKGTGLGLSISYGIVERHRGSLAAANHPDGGALFTLALPLSDSVRP